MKFYNPLLFILLLCLTLAWLYLYWYRHNYKNIGEGFQQQRAFISKTGADIYDSFYAEIYDELMLSDKRAENLVDAIVHVSQPTLRYSSFLDVGSGTGAVIERLVGAGYKAIGIDRSEDMIRYCQKNNDSLHFLHGDVLDSMQFDRAKFSHVICSGMTLYEWRESEVLKFFRNSYFWMIAGGYLFVHLVDPLLYSPVVLAAVDSTDRSGTERSGTDRSGTERSGTERITDTEINFLDFSYKSIYTVVDGSSVDGSSVDKSSVDKSLVDKSSVDKSSSSCGCTSHRESFIDAKTRHVRENEIMMYMYSVDDIVSFALRSGFVVKAKWNLLDSPYSDAYQYIYMFERTL